MTRLIIGAITLALAAAGCSQGDVKRSPETLASARQPLQPAAADAGPTCSKQPILPVDPICRSFSGYRAALAAATVDCRGSIQPSDYRINTAGILEPTFDNCPNEPTPPLPIPRQIGGTAKMPQLPALERIKHILSIQLQTNNRLPDGTLAEKKCIAGVFAAAADAIGVTAVGPNWHKKFAGGVPTKENMSRLAARFPKPFLDQTANPPMWTAGPKPPPGSGFRMPNEYFFYTVSWDNKMPSPVCRGFSLARCAELFAALYDGFFVSQFGSFVVGDPAWMDPTVYDNWEIDDADPYRVTGYFHPMSYSDGGHDLIAGVIYGDLARAKVLDPIAGGGILVPNPDKQSELCTRWDGRDDRMGRLVMNDVLGTGMLDPTVLTSECVFWPASFPNPFDYSFTP
jgi:hypothetical protein